MAQIGYARVSTPEQSLDRQIDELTTYGCSAIFSEAASGKRGAHRPEWDACLRHLRGGDSLVVTELSRLGRNTGDLGQLLNELDERRIGLAILNLGIDTKTANLGLTGLLLSRVAGRRRAPSLGPHQVRGDQRESQ